MLEKLILTSLFMVDAFQQAANAGIRSGKARLIVDRDLCADCGIRGGVNSIA